MRNVVQDERALCCRMSEMGMHMQQSMGPMQHMGTPLSPDRGRTLLILRGMGPVQHMQQPMQPSAKVASLLPLSSHFLPFSLTYTSSSPPSAHCLCLPIIGHHPVAHPLAPCQAMEAEVKVSWSYLSGAVCVCVSNIRTC